MFWGRREDLCHEGAEAWEPKVRVNTEEKTGQGGGDVEIRDPRGSSGALRALAAVTVCMPHAHALGRM